MIGAKELGRGLEAGPELGSQSGARAYGGDGPEAGVNAGAIRLDVPRGREPSLAGGRCV